mmetsp:Transcript_26568/g.87263  ORF Transcript_26568/g.87263 Transcript_26568/m.87263 type:complete len:254 (-) Transcript_26568:339-1100(-)
MVTADNRKLAGFCTFDWRTLSNKTRCRSLLQSITTIPLVICHKDNLRFILLRCNTITILWVAMLVVQISNLCQILFDAMMTKLPSCLRTSLSGISSWKARESKHLGLQDSDFPSVLRRMEALLSTWNPGGPEETGSSGMPPEKLQSSIMNRPFMQYPGPCHIFRARSSHSRIHSQTRTFGIPRSKNFLRSVDGLQRCSMTTPFRRFRCGRKSRGLKGTCRPEVPPCRSHPTYQELLALWMEACGLCLLMDGLC